MEKQQLIEQLETLPAVIMEAQLKTLNLFDNVTFKENEVARSEADLKTSIAAETDGGKKLFPNAEAREAEFVIRAGKDADIQDKRTMLAQCKRQLDELKFEIERLRNTQSNVRVLASIMIENRNI